MSKLQHSMRGPRPAPKRRFTAAALGLVTAALLPASAVAAPALSWEQGPGYRAAAVDLPPGGKPGFTLLPSSQTGINFVNVLPEQRHLTNQILLNGSGVAAGDVDGDGWCDLYFCRMDGRNSLYRNLGGWRFQEVTAAAGLGAPILSSTGCALVDLDGDSDLDLVVNSLGHGTHIFFNDGHGHFTEAPYILNGDRGGMSAALGDLDGDGFLDLAIANYRTSALMDIPNARATFKTVGGKPAIDTFNGRPVTEPDLRRRFSIGPLGSIEEHGEPALFCRNVGGTNFVPMTFTNGAFLDEEGRPLAEPFFDWGLSVMVRDANHDGLPDIYLCNDFQSEDRFWINQGAGKFRLLPRLAQRKSSLFSMAVDFADVNRDGHDDFLVVDMLSRSHAQRMRDLPDATPPIPVIGQIDNRPQYSLNTFFVNRGDDTYAEMAQLSGLEASEWSWSCIFLDVDLDGWEDVLISNGMERAARDLDVAERLKAMRAGRNMSDAEIFQVRRMFPRLATANLAFRNLGDSTFAEVGRAWGFDTPGISHGMALADLDNDGDLDVVINNLNTPAGIYRNDTVAPRIAVRLKGLPPNTHGIGARIKVLGGPAPLQSQEVMAGGRYLASDDPMRTFAAGSSTNLLTIEVLWRGGRRSVIERAMANHIYEVDESQAAAPDASPSPLPPKSGPRLFQDVSQSAPHQHHEEPFDDFAHQPLLPNKLSQLGPGVAWFDFNGDGWEDLVIGSGKGGTMAIFLNDGHGGFAASTNAIGKPAAAADQTGLVCWHQGAKRALILAGQANYEEPSLNPAAARLFDFQAQTVQDAVAGFESSSGPLAMADIDNDGDLDLFIGGRVVPGKYPSPATSRLFRNQGGQFIPDTANARVLEKVGMVSGALFSDIDGDGDPDLILACEWGPVRLFLNERGTFTEATERWGLAAHTGWWNGVATGDFDEDGRLDIIAANWGRNTKYESYRGRPLQIYYGDFNGDGNFELIEAHYDSGLQKNVPERQLGILAAGLPSLRQRFTSHHAYSTASVEEVLGNLLRTAKVVTVTRLESTLFLNRGDHFEARPLPLEAQLTPAFGVVVGDFDGDGHEDVVLSQNFFDVQPETPRYDAGRALLLRGDGRGNFQAVPGQESGLLVYGEQRGLAAGDYDHDGRLDLAIAQNGAATKIYRNAGAAPGLRVKLEGPVDNPDGIGASVRLVFGPRAGPWRELHAGSGYWSQDSPVLVMATPERPQQIKVRWPGGRETTGTVPAQAREIRVHSDGSLEAIAP